MPDRHSTPVQPRCTTFCTSVSQSTPAPARTSGLGPSRNSIPPMVRRRMSPGNPESRKTTLLPPPKTYAGRRRSAAYASAARTSSSEPHSTNKRAFPPSPNVVYGARGTCSRSSTTHPPRWLPVLRRRDGGTPLPEACMKCTPWHTCHHAGETRNARRFHSPRILGDLPTPDRGRPGRRDLHAGWCGSRLHLEFRGGAHQGVPGGGDRRAAFLPLLPSGGRGRGKAGAAARARRARRPGGRRRVAGAEGRRPLLGRGDHYGQAGFRGGGDRVRQGDPRLDGSQGNAGRAATERTDLPAPGREHPGLRHFHARPRRAGRELERRCGAHQGVPRPRDQDRKSTRLNSSHVAISYAVFCLKKKKYLTMKCNSDLKYHPSHA